MPTLRSLLSALLSSSFCVSLTGQATLDANQGPFAGAAGVLAVDGTSAGQPGRLLTKPAGYFTSPPPEQFGKPDFRVQSMLYEQKFPPLGGQQLHIDAFSIGMDWIISNDFGEVGAPEGRWAVLLFSVTRTGAYSAGSEVAREATNGQDGAAGDLFCFEFKSAGGLATIDKVTRALDSTDIHIKPAAGTGNMTAYDWFAAQYGGGTAAEGLPSKVTAYFSVTALSAPFLPPEWYGNNLDNRSGATVFKTTWRGGTWSTPSVYIAPSDLNLTQADDIDALAVDTMHHFNEYVLYSTANPPPFYPRIQFYNHGTGLRTTYRFAGTLQPVEDRLGLGLGVTAGDVDALCAADPDWDELGKVSMATETTAPPGWPGGGGGGVGGGNDVSCVVTRWSGSSGLRGFGASRNPTSYTHDWQVIYPGMSPMTFYNVPRMSSWKGSPSVLVQPMSTSLLGLRGEFGVIENTPTGQVGSRFVGIEEWRETHHAVQSPAAFADTEGLSSLLVWPNNSNRHQSIHDASNFTSQGADHRIVIDELAWRQDGAPGTFGTAVSTLDYNQVELWLGRAANDYLAMSTNFSANIDFSNWQLCYSGPVTVTPVTDTRPNVFNIHVKLTQPFLYDPALGDLLVELKILYPPSLPYPTRVGTSYLTSHRANSVRSVGNPYATSGTPSAFCPVMRFGYRDVTDVAKTTTYGTSCHERYRSFYELFQAGAFDLGGWPPNWPTNAVRLTLSGGGYAVSAVPPGSISWHTPQTGTSLGMADDVTAPVTFPSGQTLLTPVGPLSQLLVYSNGFVTPAGTTTNVYGDPPTAEVLLNGPPRWALCWADLEPDPASANNVYADWELVGGTYWYYVTWLNVPTYTPPTNPNPPGLVTMQLAFNLSADWVEFRWQRCRVPSPAMVGWTPGSAYAPLDPGSRDLHELPVLGSVDQPVRLTAAPRAILGSTVQYTFTSTEPSNPYALMMLALDEMEPVLRLDFLGISGCQLHVNPAAMVSHFLYAPGYATYQLGIPGSTAFIGAEVYVQAFAPRIGVNPFGAVTSNGVRTIVGAQ